MNGKGKEKGKGHKTTCTWKDGRKVCKRRPSRKRKGPSWGDKKPKKRPDTPLPESDEQSIMKYGNPRFL